MAEWRNQRSLSSRAERGILSAGIEPRLRKSASLGMTNGSTPAPRAYISDAGSRSITIRVFPSLGSRFAA
jgi:hypothetical protein